jgi:hypothetical protein
MITIAPYTYNDQTGDPIYCKTHYSLDGESSLCGRDFSKHAIDRTGQSYCECKRCEKIAEKINPQD